jgi:YD repeat-containing protein
LGNGYAYAYDKNHNVIEKRQKANVHAPDSSDDIVTKYRYDTRFQKPTQIISPNGAITNFTLDVQGNVVKKVVAGVEDVKGITQNIEENYEYNITGELTKKTNGNGNITRFEYESGKLIKVIKGT